MKKLLTILLPILFVLISFNACNDDDDKKKIIFYEIGISAHPDQTTEVSIGNYDIGNLTAYAYIKGGDGTFSFKSSNQSVVDNSSISAVPTKSTDYPYFFHFKPLALGETTITVSDSEGNTAILKVTIYKFGE